VIGDPAGVESQHAGRIHNRRINRWLRAGTRDTIGYRAEEVGIGFAPVGERGTSSRCPTCAGSAAKRGRWLVCLNPACRRRHHRDVAGAQNIAGQHGGVVTQIVHLEHRRVGQPARRDRRRHLFDVSKSAARPARTRAAEFKSSESLAASAARTRVTV
jgi:transposase